MYITEPSSPWNDLRIINFFVMAGSRCPVIFWRFVRWKFRTLNIPVHGKCVVDVQLWWLVSVLQVWADSCTCQSPAYNFGTQLLTEGSSECVCSKCPLILEDMRLDINPLTDNGQGQTKEWNDKLVMSLWSFSHFRIQTEVFYSSLKAKEIGTS